MYVCTYECVSRISHKICTFKSSARDDRNRRKSTSTTAPCIITMAALALHATVSNIYTDDQKSIAYAGKICHVILRHWRTRAASSSDACKAPIHHHKLEKAQANSRRLDCRQLHNAHVKQSRQINWSQLNEITAKTAVSNSKHTHYMFTYAVADVVRWDGRWCGVCRHQAAAWATTADSNRNSCQW